MPRSVSMVEQWHQLSLLLTWHVAMMAPAPINIVLLFLQLQQSLLAWPNIQEHSTIHIVKIWNSDFISENRCPQTMEVHKHLILHFQA